MGQLIKNKHLNYWVCGFIFVIIFPIVIGLVNLVKIMPLLGWLAYLIVMPYVAGRLVDYVSDKWMD